MRFVGAEFLFRIEAIYTSAGYRMTRRPFDGCSMLLFHKQHSLFPKQHSNGPVDIS
jgi:hypothetical protein